MTQQKRYGELMKNWAENRQYRCKTCGGPARIEPGGERRWGCTTCDELTFVPNAHFSEQKSHAA